MAARPWAMPEEVRAYSDRGEIAARPDEKLAVDISRAEAYIIAYTNNAFPDEEYPEIPETVRTAVILLAESYGVSAAKGQGGMKSETYDDYSYTAAEGSLTDILGLGPLLDGYVVAAARGGVTMKLRRL